MKAELLAPAGSYETMEAAIAAGADAVYIGGGRFGARAYADNPGEEQLLRAIDYVHLHGKKLYLTVNTLLKEQELQEELYGYLAPLYREGLDAVIVQDLGVLRFIKQNFPRLPIHASTQMTITGVEGAKLLKEAGAVRVVTARELSLEEIRAIWEATHMEIESFVHGALCYCYSGQCLMSSLIGGRSGNRGRCAQPCRLPYQVWQQNRRLNGRDSSYPLSPKDMCTVRLLPQILEAGICSLKIEGRMKKAEYTAGVVEIYRKYLDRYLSGDRQPQVSREDYQQLLDLYNRDGFHESYYRQRNGKNMMALKNEKNAAQARERKPARNEALFERIRREYLEKKVREGICGRLLLRAGERAVLSLLAGEVSVSVQGETVQEAVNRPLEEEQISRQMKKTGETEFFFEQLEIITEGRIFMPMQQLNALRREGIVALENAILEGFRRDLGQTLTDGNMAPEDVMAGDAEARIPEKPGGKVVPEARMPEEPGGKVVPEARMPEKQGGKGVPEAASCGGLRKPVVRLSASVATGEQLEAVLSVEGIRAVYADCGIFPRESFVDQVKTAIRRADAAGKRLYLALPWVVRDRELDGRKEHFGQLAQEGLAGFLVRNLESLAVLRRMGLANRCRLDANVYTMNGEARRFFEEAGCGADTVPLELNRKELRQRDNRNSEMLVYGYIPMMISAQCLKKNLDGCDRKCAVLTVKDRYMKEFHAVCSCEFCYNILYNTVPLSLLEEQAALKELGCGGFRLAFTLEDGKTARRVAETFASAWLQGRKVRLEAGETTRGHFARGVE